MTVWTPQNLVQVRLRTEVGLLYILQIRPDQGSNSWPPDHDSTFYVTERPTLATQPSVTSAHILVESIVIYSEEWGNIIMKQLCK